jgi:hypothetical protein
MPTTAHPQRRPGSPRTQQEIDHAESSVCSTQEVSLVAPTLTIALVPSITPAFASSARNAPPSHSNINAADSIKTATPIKHVVIIVGENRSFDHLFATYVPKSRSERVLNLLSEGIINADGKPGPNFAKAHQFQIVSAPNGGKFFSSVDMANKQLYAMLPVPDVNGVQFPPAAGLLPAGDPGLPSSAEFLTTSRTILRLANCCRQTARRHKSDATEMPPMMAPTHMFGTTTWLTAALVSHPRSSWTSTLVRGH